MVVADQAAKAVVRATLPLHASVTVVPGLLNLTQVRNTGAAFGFLNTVEFPYKPAVMTLAAVVALVGIGVYAATLPAEQRGQPVRPRADPGGRGRQPDRPGSRWATSWTSSTYTGGDYHFWAFNVADSAITVGVGLLLLDMLRAGRHAPKTRDSPALRDGGSRSGRSRSTPTACCSRPPTCIGLQLALRPGASTAASTGDRVLDLGIYIIIAALVGAKLLLLIVDFDTYRSHPAELLSLAARRAASSTAA